MALLGSSQDDLVALAGEAADALGIPEPSFVEKDYWVVELLRSVTRPLELEPIDGRSCSARALFKGGTSLSKVFGIIERFSEDLDILIVHEGLGESARENRVLRPICERARIDLGLSDDDTEVTERSTGVKRNVAFRYPQRLPSASISPTARLEMGIRGGTLPGVVHGTVRSYIAQYVASAGVDADFEELLPVEVEAIAPVRTLAEKVALLHHAGTAALNGDPRSLEKAGRHFSDVARLLNNADVQARAGSARQLNGGPRRGCRRMECEMRLAFHAAPRRGLWNKSGVRFRRCAARNCGEELHGLDLAHVGTDPYFRRVS